MLNFFLEATECAEYLATWGPGRQRQAGQGDREAGIRPSVKANCDLTFYTVNTVNSMITVNYRVIPVNLSLPN